ncbi:unnamed protein product [Cuscuta campestris]|uniref:Protein CHAPERONE-LIKE PROTEIN OF POR1, chloroplastic n=1 Tax=Cuscuta campestris TaxID=132261 RepID=A0A484LPR1_9ASTE|nr:unnamed protein product [Cuscuta campestris]
MATTLSVRPNRAIIGGQPPGSSRRRSLCRRPNPAHSANRIKKLGVGFISRRRTLQTAVQAGSRADDSAPFEMSVENALKLLGVADGASFEDILRAKSSIVSSCKGDPETITKVEAAYDMLLMQSLSQRRAGKVADKSIRYADVKKPVNARRMGSIPNWLQKAVRDSPVSFQTPSTGELAVQAGVYGALAVLVYANGGPAFPEAAYAGGADLPGLVLATSFGATLYFITKKNVNLGKASLVTIGGLVAGAVVGSAVESWCNVDIVPFLGIHSSATLVAEFIIFSQFLVSLYLR